MALQLQHFIAAERGCSYLPDRLASLEYRVLVDLRSDELEMLLAHGWRRFGVQIFRPACRSCGECVSLRIPVDRFAPSRSQRKAHNRCRDFMIETGSPQVTKERLALYSRWHGDRESTRGWEASPIDAQDYAQNFGFADESAREVLYRDGDRLIGVGICDELPNGWSAVYFFHDPEYARFSLGVNHILTLIDLARAQGKAHVYLGYRVKDCPSMQYKGTFFPHQLLEGRPALDEAPKWHEVSQPAQDTP
ncbi:MAG: arginyltransferase [Myxococcaceae bacterium]